MIEILTGIVGLLVGLLVGMISLLRAKAEASKLRLEIAARDKGGWTERTEQQMRDTFTALASDVLRTSSEALTTGAVNSLIGVVDPLKQRLDSLDGCVRELEKARVVAYTSIGAKLEEIVDKNEKLRQATNGLTQSLRSPNIRGQWGEIQLRRVVELAGMVKHVDFSEQVSTGSGRPDMIVHIPERGILPLDAKVALDAYLNAMATSDEDQRKRYLQSHAKAMRDRVNELGLRKYWEQFESAPEFIIMFVPNEACLGIAFEQDPNLMEYAMAKSVLIASPVTLLSILRAVAYGWQQHQITENARMIGREGHQLYDRLRVFVDRFRELGDVLGKTVERYNSAVGSFNKRLLPTTRRFQEFGLSTTKIEAPEKVDFAPSIPQSVDLPSGA